jgi:hypothetical protein
VLGSTVCLPDLGWRGGGANLDRGDVDGASKDGLSVVVRIATARNSLSLPDGALDGVALLVGLGVEQQRVSQLKELIAPPAQAAELLAAKLLQPLQRRWWRARQRPASWHAPLRSRVRVRRSSAQDADSASAGVSSL